MRISPHFLSLTRKRAVVLGTLAASLVAAGALVLSPSSQSDPINTPPTAETTALPSAPSPIILSQTPVTIEQPTVLASAATSPQQEVSVSHPNEKQTSNYQVTSSTGSTQPVSPAMEAHPSTVDKKTTELKASLGEDKYEALVEIPRELLAKRQEEGFQVAYQEDLTGSLDDTAEYLKIDTEWSEVRPDTATKAAPSDNNLITARALAGPVTTPAQQPTGSLSDIIVYTNPGHGFVALTSWTTQRGITNGMVEDFGNLDQFTWFTQYMFNAGATVVPFRPIGFQSNEVVLDNDDTSVTWTGTWSDSTSTIFYGSAGDTPYRWADTSNVSETAIAKYTPTIPEDGVYPVYCWTRHGSDRIHQTYRVVYAGGSTEVQVNHKRVGLGWVWLGSYYFEAGTTGYVEIPNYHATETGVVIADTIRFGNGMGDIDRGFGVSGQPRWMESNRYWIANAVSQGMSTDIYDGTGDDGSDTVGAPPKMAVSMNRETDGSFYDRIIFSIHSNALNGSVRGAMGLAADGNDPVDQYVIAQMANDEIELDMEALDSGVAFPYDSVDSSGDVYDGVDYGEISDRYLVGEMTGTIIEVAFHDNVDDAYIMQDPRCRNAMGRACYQSIVKFLNQHGDNNVPSDLLPEPPTDVYAVNNGNGTVTVGWTPPVSDGIGGEAATGYIVSRSTNGFGFGSPVTVSGGTSTSTTISGLTAGQTYYFQVAATNAGGTSLPADILAVRVLASATADVLIVNGFDRSDRFLSPNVYFSNNLNGYARLVRPHQINSFDYVIEHAKAITNYGESFDSANADAVEGGDVTLGSYDAVVWIGGAQGEVDASGAQPEFAAFSSTLQTQIQSYLNAGGNLFVSGSELAWDMDADVDQTDADSVFLQSVLKTDYVDDDVYTGVTTPPNTVIGASGSIFDGVSLAFDNGDDGIYNVDFPDVINAINGSNVVMTYTGSSEGTVNAAIQFAGVDYKVIFMGFPFETILDESDRNSVMTAALTFLLDTTTITPSPTPDGTPTPSPTPSPSPTVSPTPDPNAGPVEDFESYTTGISVMFQDPGWSGSSSGVNTATDTVAVSALYANDILDPTINSTGTQSERLFWTWTTPGTGFVRATTYATTYRPNPIIDLTQGVSVYIKCVQGEIDVALWIRETGVSGTIGDNGGTSGAIEEITSKQRITASNDWQYLYFDLPNESYAAVTGDGTLDGSWGTIEALAVSAVSGSSVANVDIYVDDIYNGAQHTPIGASTPTPSPTPTVSPTPSPSPTASPTPTVSPTPTPSPTASPSPTAPPVVYIHVDSIVLSTSGNKNKNGVATVTVVDANSSAMSGVTVSGTFSGDYSESKTGVTDSNGSVTITTSGKTRAPLSFTFCVTNLSDGSSTYDSSANVESCDTASF